MTTTGMTDGARFLSSASRYADYLATPEGRLRSDLAFANLRDFLPDGGNTPLHVLDVGCGTGAVAIRLAQLGMHVTMLDSSPAMLDIASRAAQQAGVAGNVVLQHGDAAQLSNLYGPGRFDVIVCHNVLEYCDDPSSVLREAATVLRDSSSILSIVVRNRAGEVLKAAIQAGDVSAANDALTAEWGQESLYGGSVRLFTPASLRAMISEASLSPIAERGVRVLADYLPARVSRTAEYDATLGLERKLGARPEYAAIARYTQCVAHRVSSAKEGA